MGPGKIVLLLFVLFLLVGVKRVPALVASIGKGLRQLKGSLEQVGRPDDDPDREAADPVRAARGNDSRPAARSEPRRLVSPRDDERSHEPRRLL